MEKIQQFGERKALAVLIIGLIVFIVGGYYVAEAKTVECGDLKINSVSSAEINTFSNGKWAGYTYTSYEKSEVYTNGKYRAYKKIPTYNIFIPNDVEQWEIEYIWIHETGHYILDHLSAKERNLWKKRFSKKTSSCSNAYGLTDYHECFAVDFVNYSYGIYKDDNSFQYKFISGVVDKLDSGELVFPIEECFKK